MHELPFERVFKFPEGSKERLAEEAAQLIRQLEADIATEVYHEAYGAGAEPESDEAKELEEEHHNEARKKLESMLKDSGLVDEALELYNKFASGEKGAEEASNEMRELLLPDEE